MSVNRLAAADALFNAGKYAEARALCTPLFSTAPDPSLKTEAASLIARTFLAADRMLEARQWLEKAARTASADYPAAWSRYLSVRGRLEWKQHDPEAARRTFQTLHDYCRNRPLAERSIDALRMLGIISPLPEQAAWSKQAIAEAQAARLDKMLAPLWTNLAATHEDLGQHAEALAAYLHARDFHRQFGTPLQQLQADWAVAHTQRLLGHLAEARELLTLLLPAFEELDADEPFGWTCHELAHIHLAQANHTEALDYFLRAKTHLTAAGIDDRDPATLEKINTHITRLQSSPI